jgi:hypothetical protein
LITVNVVDEMSTIKVFAVLWYTKTEICYRVSVCCSLYTWAVIP